MKWFAAGGGPGSIWVVTRLCFLSDCLGRAVKLLILFTPLCLFPSSPKPLGFLGCVCIMVVLVAEGVGCLKGLWICKVRYWWQGGWGNTNLAVARHQCVALGPGLAFQTFWCFCSMCFLMWLSCFGVSPKIGCFWALHKRMTYLYS